MATVGSPVFSAIRWPGRGITGAGAGCRVTRNILESVVLRADQLAGFIIVRCPIQLAAAAGISPRRKTWEEGNHGYYYFGWRVHTRDSRAV